LHRTFDTPSMCPNPGKKKAAQEILRGFFSVS
jgi:hypothetical protein